jgi:hypothetical protein
MMNKRKLQDFATWAKQNLEKQIEISLKKIGIHSLNNIKQSRVKGDITTIDGIEETYDKGFQKQRDEIVNRIKTDGYDHSIEQFASTWFNRIAALRFMEVHDYLNHGFKIFPKEQNTLPELLAKLSLVSNELNLDMDYCQNLLDSGNNHEELYRYILFQQSNALAKPLPMLFSHSLEYLEYFIPTPLLFGDTIINRLIKIDENDFKEDVEIIGWLYQFYIASKKKEVLASKKTITKETLPAVTQLFTPDWIVRYMAENSVGRIWIESYATSPLKSKMKYYVEEAEQEPEVLEQLETIKYKNVNPEEIRIIEPACGSGHILVYVFELLFEMYLEKGYSRKDIPQLILKNNIVGLDIDQRASQLASFALAMKARSIDNRFLEQDRNVRPRVYEIIDSKSIIKNQFNGKSYLEILKDYNSNQWKGDNQLTDEELKVVKYVVDLFEDAKVIGSLLKVKPYKYLSLRKKLVTNVVKHNQTDIFTSAFFEYEFKELVEIVRLAYILSSQYDVMITNPPYIGTSGLEKSSKAYLSKQYPNSKADMFAMFMEKRFVKYTGLTAMINMHSWMFLNSYDALRKSLIKESIFICAIHLGSRAFEMIGGEVVQTITFVKRDIPMNFVGTYSKLIDYNSPYEKEKNWSANLYFTPMYLFSKFPSNQFIYWSKNAIANIFINNPKLGDFGIPKSGIMTGKDSKFVRLWHEVSITNSSLYNNDLSKMNHSSNIKWFPLTRGGEYRKWYGNLNAVVNMHNNGYDISNLPNNNFRLRDFKYYFKECATWTMISSNSLSVRYVPKNVLYGNGGPTFFPTKHLLFTIGLLNSKVANYFTKMLNPTINTIIDDIVSIPYIEKDVDRIEHFVNDCIRISKSDWDFFETSWDFKKHILVTNDSISATYSKYDNLSKSNFRRLKNIEEDLNVYFINLYNLQDELTKDIDNTNVSVSVADKTREIKSLISYLVGVLMGRYSLVEEGLIFAGGAFDPSRYGSYDIDEDGIIPIFSDLSFENGLVHRIIGLIKAIYGQKHYRDNVDFIADALGKKANETSEETLNRYLNDDFYSNHLKTYQKRPIYWMFSSGKKNGFKALVYLHRYNYNTLAKMNASYFQPATTVLRTRISEIEKQIQAASDKEKIQLERARFSLIEQLNEAIEYGQVLDYMANKYISIDLDDGVQVNYEKFQKIEINTSNGKVKKDLLVPIK